MEDRKIQRAFEMGYQYGWRHNDEASSREAEALHPTMTRHEIDAFCQGTHDGKLGDMSRI